jgi:hypothetical protein
MPLDGKGRGGASILPAPAAQNSPNGALRSNSIALNPKAYRARPAGTICFSRGPLNAAAENRQLAHQSATIDFKACVRPEDSTETPFPSSLPRVCSERRRSFFWSGTTPQRPTRAPSGKFPNPTAASPSSRVLLRQLGQPSRHPIPRRPIPRSVWRLTLKNCARFGSRTGRTIG